VSADNYLFVRKYRGKYYIEMRFASNDYDERSGPNKHFGVFDSPDEAIRAAHRETHRDYYEYGVEISPKVAADWDAMTAPKAG
jgi:hypothetical protein